MNDSNNISKRRKEIKKIALSTLRNAEPVFHKQAQLSITITGGGIEEYLNQPHKHYFEKNEMLLRIRSVLEQATYMGISSLRGKKSFVFETELCGEKTWLIVNEVKGRGASLYSISDSDKVLTGIKKPI
ncbi:MAG: hypothetical protein J6W26_04580 [Bacteroidales bacterium]|nr:hypothetical protein [Bacteroidales bacterium]